jgi:hypothetical protein
MITLESAIARNGSGQNVSIADSDKEKIVWT